MSEFGIVEDTMFIPMVGRIYATEKFPGILYDKKALSLKEKLPSALLETGNQSQYTLLVTAGGLFHYFQEEKVLGLLQMLEGFGNIELVFDTVNKSGMKMLQKKYMKQMGHENARMFFYVNSAEDLVTTLGRGVKVLADEPYYKFIKRDGLKIITKISMDISDRFGMLKMIHLEWR